jgi:hypothetical protein
LGRVLVRLLVLLVLQHDDLQTDVPGSNEERGAGKADKTDTPREDDTEDDADDEGGDGLHDGTERDAGETVDLLRVIRKRGYEPARAVLILVEEGDVLAKDGLERERTETGGEVGRSRREEIVLEPNGEHRTDGDDEEVEAVHVAFTLTLAVVVADREAGDAPSCEGVSRRRPGAEAGAYRRRCRRPGRRRHR